MERRNSWIILTVAIACLSLASAPAWAGSKQQHRWEGVAIGVGAAIIGSALIHHPGIHVSAPASVVHYTGYYREHRHRFGYHGRGKYRHWRYHEWRKHPRHYRPYFYYYHPRHHVKRHGHKHPGRHFRSHDNHGRRHHYDRPRHDRGRRGNRN